MQGVARLSSKVSRSQSALAIVLAPMADHGSIASVGQKPLGLGQRVEQGERTGVALTWPALRKNWMGLPCASVTAWSLGR